MSVTLVEFYDKSSLENMVSSLVLRPRKVIFLGSNIKQMERQIEKYRILSRHKDIPAEFECKVINKNSLSEIQTALYEIADKNPDCAVDLTGGDELSLVAVGTVAQKLKDRNFSFHRVNINTRKLIEFFDTETEAEIHEPMLTVDECISLYGGSVVYDSSRENYTQQWDWNAEFVSDIKKLWLLCKKECILWNSMITALSDYIGPDSLTVSVHGTNDPQWAPGSGGNYRWIQPWQQYLRFFKELQKINLIHGYSYNEEGFSFICKNWQILRCFSKAGNILELITFLTMRELKGKGGVPFFDDIVTGVYIDWDGVLHEKEDNIRDTFNEIDIIAMKGLIPYFISCKNGRVLNEELYKLKTVAERFGGEYARKILVATYMDNSRIALEYFRQRAEDMGIAIIEGVHNINENEFARKFKAILS